MEFKTKKRIYDYVDIAFNVIIFTIFLQLNDYMRKYEIPKKDLILVSLLGLFTMNYFLVLERRLSKWIFKKYISRPTVE
jgi:hypothetical protein